jgi:dephospho-CoA kinase
MTFVLGLTGSIGMGKSATAHLFRSHGVPVYDADATVHALYRGKAVPLIEAAFPSAIVDGAVDRPLLSALVLGKPDLMKQLEAIVHPLVREAEQAFLMDMAWRHVPLVVLDIPLLFETSGPSRCDAVLVVHVDAALQRQRVLERPGMTEERFHAILARQMPDSEKCRRAHFVIETSRGLALANRPGRVIADLMKKA